MEIIKLTIMVLEFGFKVVTWTLEQKTTMKKSLGASNASPAPSESKIFFWIILSLILYIIGEKWIHYNVIL
ncbi:hypothetical protein [Listeria booriae]|uniref:Uncharacterized protein n=1 Tax=Listeria booriae TaxID=1552123 RepID=A0A841ZZ57_9LIST|nr:hypothetical protein [Listeria booriae]MBC1566019.1 hypothetical protein [Listeria booriae]